jgi:AcrR family transcriptional regulator
MARPSDPSARERIIEVATRLFADRGYAGTTTRAIAGEVGANIATVRYHVGGKFDLFRTVLERLYREEIGVLSERLESLRDLPIADSREVIDVLVDVANAMIDLMASRPERPRLYLRRWLDPPDEIRPLEIRMSLEEHRLLRDLLERAKAAGAMDSAFPVDTFLRSFTWLICGYFATGPIDWERWFSDPLDPRHLRDLRSLVEQYIRRSFESSWSATPAGYGGCVQG